MPENGVLVGKLLENKGALKSRNTVETYRDALTVFRRYVTDTLHLSIRSFGFEDCTRMTYCCPIWSS